MKKSGSVVLSIGLLLLALGAYLLFDEQKFVISAELVSGTVTDLALYESADGSPDTYCPVVSFTTSGGAEKNYEMDVCTSPASKSVGDHVDLYYSAAEDSVQQKGFRSQYFGSAVSGFLGILFVIDGVRVIARKNQ